MYSIKSFQLDAFYTTRNEEPWELSHLLPVSLCPANAVCTGNVGHEGDPTLIELIELIFDSLCLESRLSQLLVG